MPHKYILVTFNNVLTVESQLRKNLNVLCTLNVVSRIIKSVQRTRSIQNVKLRRMCVTVLKLQKA